MEKALLTPFTEAGLRLGIAKQTSRNWAAADKFPLTTFLVGSRRMVRTEDIEKYVANLGGDGQPRLELLANSNSSVAASNGGTEVKVKRGRGRPRKQQLPREGSVK